MANDRQHKEVSHLPELLPLSCREPLRRQSQSLPKQQRHISGSVVMQRTR
jgi:hypothetical protein